MGGGGLSQCRTPTYAPAGGTKRDLVLCGQPYQTRNDVSSQSIISSARTIRDSGTSIPKVFAVVMLMTSSKRLGNRIGRSAGFGRTNSANDASARSPQRCNDEANRTKVFRCAI